jgi:chemotaxis signal transduction protein
VSDAYVGLDTEHGRLAVALGAVRAVLEPHGIVPLPEPRLHVLGLLRPDREALTVLAPFGTQGEHVVVLDAGPRRFGLLVERVTGVLRAAPWALGPAPEGQAEPLLSGRLRAGGELRLVVDADVLAERLGPADPAGPAGPA